MDNIIKKFRALRYAGIKKMPTRGEIPQVDLPNYEVSWYGLRVFVGTTSIFFIIGVITLLWMKNTSLFAAMDRALGYGIISGLIVTSIYYLLPILRVLAFVVWYRRRPTRQILANFPTEQKFVCLGLIAFGLVYLFNHTYPILYYAFHTQHWPHHWLSTKPYITAWWHIGVIWIAIIVLLAILLPRLFSKNSLPHHANSKNRFKRFTSNDLSIENNLPFGIWLGHSTGILASLWHRTGIAPGLEVVLSLEDITQNLLVLGGIGAGKTTRLMQPALAQLLDQNCGGLLFDIKGDVKKATLKLGEITNRQITIIGPGYAHMNILADLTPEVAASFLKSSFLLSGGMRVESFWIDTATELCRNTLGLLSFLPEHYTLQGLYSYLFDEEAKKQIETELNPLLVTLPPNEQRLLKSYLRYHDTIFVAFDDKIKSGVSATVAQALAPFNHPDLVDAFCQGTKKTKELEEVSARLNMQSVLDGTIYLVDMPLSRWGLGGKVAYTFIKLWFFNIMQSRVHHPDWNQDRPVFFMCDEYQEIISANKDGLSDLNFWDKSRSSKTLGIISAQSVSSFYAALGDRDLAHAILQNFRQKICFRTEDEATLSMLDTLAGRAKVQRLTESTSESKASRSLTDSSKHHSSAQSITESRESVLDAALFRNLNPNQAIFLLSFAGHSMDDVLELFPLYI